MALKEEDQEKILKKVKQGPCTIQELSRLIGRSWITADAYVQQIKQKTGLIDVKVFRKGTQGALKIVYYALPDALREDEAKEQLYLQIKHGKNKTDFDFMELFQFIPQEQKRSFFETYDREEVSKDQHIVSLFQSAQHKVFCFSGNLSFINIEEKGIPLIEVMEELLKKRVSFKILSKINIASMNNLPKIQLLARKYPDLIEIRHCYQPLRGFLIDDKIARFKNEEQLSLYKQGELLQNTRIFYEIYDKEWILWLEKVFWNLFRSSIDYQQRMKEIQEIF